MTKRRIPKFLVYNKCFRKLLLKLPTRWEWVAEILFPDDDMELEFKQFPVNGQCNKNPKEWPEDLRIQEYPKP